MLTKDELNNLLAALPRTRIGVIGDFCLDIYWQIDLSASEPSIETGLPTRPVRSQRYGLGGAGTVVNNLVAMGVGSVAVFGVIGEDPFGREMRRRLDTLRVDRTGVITQGEGWDTLVYLKPIRGEKEEPRIDLGNFNQLNDERARACLAALEAALPRLDVVIVNQQIRQGIHTPWFQEELNRLLETHPSQTFIVDSRHLAGAYVHCHHRLNEMEATRLCGAAHEPGDVISAEEAGAAARQLFSRWGKPVFVSRGARGCLVAAGDGVRTIPGLHLINPTDPVGAGDSMLAGIAAALAAGYPPGEAAAFGNLVAGVTVQKLLQTGTASPAEIRAIGEDPDYVYEPELADDPRQANYWEGSEIELVDPHLQRVRISHAIFDHDGTISVLRQGWEQVMEPTMVKAILGKQFASADETLYARAVKQVREYIDHTTGVQTLVQMQGLVRMVREFGLVPAEEIRDEYGYKAEYNEALMTLVRRRLGKLERGELGVEDLVIKKVLEWLDRLDRAGIQLYLASGTDEHDVRAEAETLGYARLFKGRIYGSVGDPTREVKRVVLDRILQEIGPRNFSGVVTFGDGPVEIRETRRRGGLAIGVASDEVRRHGWNMTKRSRLIRAGAHVVIPDFSQSKRLMPWLGLA